MGWLGLYGHQRDVIEKMKNGCVLRGRVGSGKSRAALAYYFVREGGDIFADEYIPLPDPPRDLYIITTAKKRDSLEWGEEMSPFLLSTNKEVNLYDNSIVVDSWNNIKKYKDVKNAFFIFDEQRLVGSGAWVQSFLKIAKFNEWILLSATPGDTWTDLIPVFIANGFYKNRTEFTSEHVIYQRFSKFPKVDRYVGTKKLERIRNNIFVEMEYKNANVLHHEDVYVEYDLAKYNQVGKKRWNIYKNVPIKNAAELCYTWRKVVNSDESRQKALLEIVERKNKVIVFYNFNYELDILKSLYYGEGFKVAEWNGRKHEPIPDSDKWVYLTQYTAGAEGWNCTSTDTVVFYSQNYSYKIVEQSGGRIDRLNTPFTDLYYYHFKSRASIDLGISRSLKEKKKFNERKFAKW